mmetsp:Transcript_26220/g.60923  ORF Transcript_26220/g.60923 Transcript_26220/m.60923 type:complete len:214 (-) Transcript_26220:297-938(-)
MFHGVLSNRGTMVHTRSKLFRVTISRTRCITKARSACGLHHCRICGSRVWLCVHVYLIRQQASRNRAMFARRIAETIDMRASVRNLTPDALAREFRRIDEGVSRDGKISKEELWEFVSSGKAGEMDQRDFDALFAAMDLDHNGDVDFVEFCAFLGKCDAEYRAVRRRSSVGLQQPMSMVARRLSETASQRGSVVDPSAAIAEQEEEEAKAEET